MVKNQSERTNYKRALGWKKVSQKMEYEIEAKLEQFFLFYILIPAGLAATGGLITYMLWDEDLSLFTKLSPIFGMFLIGVVISFLIRNKTTTLKDNIDSEADALEEDRQIAGAKRVSAKKYSELFPQNGSVVRIEQKKVYRRKKNLTKKIGKNGNVEFVSDSDQYDYFEPLLFQDRGLCIVVDKVLTADEQKLLKAQKKELAELHDEVVLENEIEKTLHININDEEALKNEGIEALEREDVLLPLSQFKTHMYIQGRAGSGKSVLYSKFYRATLGLADGVDEEGLLKIKPDEVVLDIMKRKGVVDITKHQQELIDALKCKNVIIDTKGDVYAKYFRGDFVIKNTDETTTKGKDVMYAGGLDDNSIPYDFSYDLTENGKLNELAVNNFAEAIFKTADITSDAEKFWAVNGKNVVRAAITAIHNNDKLTNKKLYNWLKSDKLVDLIKKDPKAKRIAGAAIEGKDDSERILGILSGITEKAIFLEWVATDRESKGTFSFKKWFNDGVPGTLFLVATDELVDILMPLYGVITSFMLEAIFTRDEDADNLPVYWYGDEMPKMGKIAGIEKGLTFGRSKNLRMFPGVQHNVQLEDIYKEKAKSIAEGAGQKALFAQGGPEAAKFCVGMLGTSRVVNKNNGVRMGEHGEEHTQNEARDNKYEEVLDSEFMFMQPTTFILAGEYEQYTKVSVNFHKIKKMRNETKQFKLTLRDAEIEVEKKRFGKSIFNKKDEDLEELVDLDDLEELEDDEEVII